MPRQLSFTNLLNYAVKKHKKEQLEEYRRDYNSNRYYDMIVLLGALTNNKGVAQLDNWTTIKNKIIGKEKTDNRSDRQVEEDTINLYNKYFLKEG